MTTSDSSWKGSYVQQESFIKKAVAEILALALKLRYVITKEPNSQNRILGQCACIAPLGLY